MSLVRFPTQIHQSVYAWNNWGHVVPAGVALELAASPEYWQHVKGQFKNFDLITVVAEDGAYEASIRVLSIVRGELKLGLRAVWRREDAPAVVALAVEPDDLYVEFGGKHQWRVVDRKTKEVLSHGFDKAGAENERVRLLAMRAAV